MPAAFATGTFLYCYLAPRRGKAVLRTTGELVCNCWEMATKIAYILKNAAQKLAHVLCQTHQKNVVSPEYPSLGFTFSPKIVVSLKFRPLALDKHHKKYYSVGVNKLETFQISKIGNVSNFGTENEKSFFSGIEPGQKRASFQCCPVHRPTELLLNKKE